MKISENLEKEKLKELDKPQLSAANHKIPRIWVLVADQHRARVFKRSGDHLELLGEATPDKIIFGFGEKTMHHKYAPDRKLSQIAEASFGAQIAEWLGKGVQEDAFDRLVLVAAPHMLGDLRKELNKEVHARIVAEVSKDLTKHNETELRKDLAEIVWF
jgi:protein required for attachment to host cells